MHVSCHKGPPLRPYRLYVWGRTLEVCSNDSYKKLTNVPVVFLAECQNCLDLCPGGTAYFVPRACHPQNKQLFWEQWREMVECIMSWPSIITTTKLLNWSHKSGSNGQNGRDKAAKHKREIAKKHKFLWFPPQAASISDSVCTVLCPGFWPLRVHWLHPPVKTMQPHVYFHRWAVKNVPKARVCL